MKIRNNLDYAIVVNCYNRKDLVKFDKDENYRLDGLFIQPRESAWIVVTADDVLFISNISKTFASYVIMASVLYGTDSDYIMNVWDNVSDIVRCQQLGESQKVNCKDSINIVLSQRLHNLLILKLYNGFTYFIFTIIIALVISATIIAGTFLI